MADDDGDRGRAPASAARSLPTGTVTFLFTDVEGSTRLLHELGAEAYAQALAVHRRVMRDAFGRYGGVEVDTQGDAFFVAFPTAGGAVAAARDAQAALADGPLRVRMGVHTGTPVVTGDGYVGPDVHRAARIAAAGHGGQVLVSAATAALLGRDGLRDLGEQRLKDLSAPERIYQLGDADLPPLNSLHQTNLPMPATPFVGRERELSELTGLIRRDGVRLLTLTGPGGTGKTRLALEAAAAAADFFPGGVSWVPLAPVRDPQLVLDTTRVAIGAKEELADHVGDRQMLLLLDNFEQVVEAAPVVGRLLQLCPRLRLVVTSRELLGIPGEYAYAVPPLEPADSVELFVGRARATVAAFEPDAAVSALCGRLDNLPLAIELAAARVRLLSPAQLLERLGSRLDVLRGGRGRDPRQQTLRATIEWSHDLLNADEQALFRRLSVFRDGWTLEAAEKVCDADLDVLQSLVDKSLVRVREGDRFSMLETIREYADERLVESGNTVPVADRHLQYFVDLAERAYDELATAEEKWSSVVAREHDNVRAALDWAFARRPSTFAQLIGAIAAYWMRRGHAKEARARLDDALAVHDSRDAVRARALLYRAELDDDVGQLEEALSLSRELGDLRAEANALESIGWAHDSHGDYDAARLAHEASLRVREVAGRPPLEGALARAGLCHVLVALAEVDSAEAAARELLAVAERSDASYLHQLALHFLADCPLVAADYEEAERRYRRALAFAHRAELVGRSTDEVLGIAMSLAGQGHAERALRLAASAHVKQEELGKTADAWWASMQQRHLGAARSELTQDEVEAVERAGRDTSFEAVVDDLLQAERV